MNATATTSFTKGGDGHNMMEASAQWAKRPADQRFKTLAELRSKVHGRRVLSSAIDIDLGRVHFEAQGGKLVANSTISPCEPSHWSFGQMAGEIKAPAAYLRTLPMDLLLPLLNHGVKENADGTAKFMTVRRDDEESNTLQAVTSPTYGRIWDADVVDAVGRLVERTNGKFHNPLAYAMGGGEPVPSGLYASDRDVFMFMIDGGSVLELGPRAILNRGFIVKNSEVGAAVFELITFLFNKACGNHIIYGARDINKLAIRHTQGGPYRFDAEAAPLLMSYAESSAATEETVIRKAMATLLPKEDADLWAIASGAKLTRGELREAKAFAKAEEGKFESFWDLVQGCTAYARGIEFVDARTDLEKRAGAILKRFED